MLTPSDIARLQTSGLQKTFMDGVKSYEPMYPKVTTKIKSTKASEDYGWLGENTGLREWLDERAPHALLEQGFTITNKDYEDTIAVDRNALADDQYGQIKIRVNGMGRSAEKSKDELFAIFVEENGLCYDGQNFFDTDHEEGESGSQSNIESSGKALSSTTLQEAVENQAQFLGDTGRLAGITSTHLMVPTGLKFTAKEILMPKTRDGDRTMEGELELIVNPFLTTKSTAANSKWYVLDLSQGVAPFVFQERDPIKFVALDNATSEELFKRKKIYYGVDTRFAFGYGNWRQAVRFEG